MTAGADKLRLFYALWPDESTRMKLAALQQQVSGRKMRAENLHLTLAFLGNQPHTLLPILEEILQQLPLQRLQIDIDRLDYFSKPRIAWAGPKAAPAALFTLQSDLMLALEKAQIQLKPIAGFRPHITLTRDAPPPLAAEIQAIRWEATEMALLQSVSSSQGPQYHVLAQRILP